MTSPQTITYEHVQNTLEETQQRQDIKSKLRAPQSNKTLRRHDGRAVAPPTSQASSVPTIHTPHRTARWAIVPVVSFDACAETM